MGSGLPKTVHVDQSECHSGTSLIHFGVVIFSTSLYSVIILSISERRMSYSGAVIFGTSSSQPNSETASRWKNAGENGERWEVPY